MNVLELPFPPSVNTDCQDGPGERTRLGYVRVWVDGRRRLAHVIEWEALNGQVSPGMELDHMCKNRWCRNPAHLEMVTHAENCRRSKATKLNWEKVRAIRSRFEAGESLSQLGRDFGVTKQNIKLIVDNRHWKETVCT